MPLAELATRAMPGWVKIGMEFTLTASGQGTHIGLRTVISAPDPATLTAFSRYWFIIKPASWAIRRELLLSLRRQERIHRIWLNTHRSPFL